MENLLIKEATDTLKRLSPKNQVYFMTLVRVAEVAENSVKCSGPTIPPHLPSSPAENRTA